MVPLREEALTVWLEIDKKSDLPFIRQVYEQIRGQILRGELKAGEKLPSTRDLSQNLHLSRNVILEAYDLLIAEGYIDSRLGSGSYVADGAFLEGDTRRSSTNPTPVTRREETPDVIDFRSGVPALDLLPRKRWIQTESQICNDATMHMFGYDYPEGRLELRETLSRFLKKSRGVECRPDQIIITSGAVQGLSILTTILLTPETTIIMEDPVNRKIREIFCAAKPRVVPVSTDDFGIQTGLLPGGLNPALIFVTPSHQYPTGGNLPITRRIDLIQYARSSGCYIIEDDYDSEFRYEGAPVSSLQGLDPDHVIYVGTFSKTLFPALRLGYMVLPWPLVEDCRLQKYLIDNHSTTLNQLTMARFIAEGHFERHVARMKKIYRRRRDSLIAALKDSFSDHVTVNGQSTGLHLIAQFHGVNFNEVLVNLLQSRGVAVYPVEEHAIVGGLNTDRIILGYSHLESEAILEGVQRIRRTLSNTC